MKRKVIKQGHNTFTVTLPIKWAKKVGLNAGSEIDVLEQGSSLVINPPNSTSKGGRAEVDITGLPNPLLWRFVSSAYRAGYDEIKIDFEGIEDDQEKLSELSYDITDWFYRGELPHDRVNRLTAIEAIQALINRFIGVEITDQRQNHVIVKQLGEISYNEFGNALKRIFTVLISMGNEVLTAVKNNDRQTLRAIHMIDTNIDRFEDYCLRVLNIKGYEDYKKTPTIYSTIFLLEMVGDEYKRIANHIIRDKHKYGQAALNFFEEVNKQFESYVDLFYHFDRAKTIAIFEKENEFTELAKKLFKEVTDDEKELLHHLKKITRFTISLVELAIDIKSESTFESASTLTKEANI